MANRPGRPALDPTAPQPSAAVHLKLPAADYDRAAALAKEQRKNIQDVIRDGLTRLLRDERGGSI